MAGPSHARHGNPMTPFEHRTPIIHPNVGHHGHHDPGALFGEQAYHTHDLPPKHHPPEEMVKLSPEVEVVDEDDTKHHNKGHKKDEKKQCPSPLTDSIPVSGLSPTHMLVCAQKVFA